MSRMSDSYGSSERERESAAKSSYDRENDELDARLKADGVDTTSHWSSGMKARNTLSALVAAEIRVAHPGWMPAVRDPEFGEDYDRRAAERDRLAAKLAEAQAAYAALPRVTVKGTP